MTLFWSDAYDVTLPPGHRFPMAKYRCLRGLLESAVETRHGPWHTPEPAGWDALRAAHESAYLNALRVGRLERAAERRLGFPLSEGLVLRARSVVAGTLGAARVALARGWAGNLGGGTHHAFRDRGEGFCVLNDVVFAVHALRAEGVTGHVLVLDLDVHQGNGTAASFRDDPTVFTFSMHGERNYPFHKEASDLDVALPDGCKDEDYLRALAAHLPEVLAASRPELVFYLAGVDPHVEDRLGRLELSTEGLQRRDRLVFEAAREAGAALVVLPAGGYAETPERTAQLHAGTFLEAVSVLGDRGQP